MDSFYREEQLATVRQVGCCLAHALAEFHQILVEAPSIERAESDAHGLPINARQPWKMEERPKPLPRRLGIGLRKIVVARPHDFIGERQLKSGHHLILRVIQLVHRPLARCQIFQMAQEVALALAGPLAGVESCHNSVFDFPLALLERSQLGCCLLLERLAFLAQQERPHGLPACAASLNCAVIRSDLSDSSHSLVFKPGRLKYSTKEWSSMDPLSTVLLLLLAVPTTVESLLKIWDRYKKQP